MTEEQRIQQAVDEALRTKQVKILAKELNNLQIEIKGGFKGVHARQDLTNGKVLLNTRDVGILKKIVFGAVTIILVSFMGGLTFLVFK